MKTIKILHIYSQALDLYGDYKNLTVLCQRIRESGNEAEITALEQSAPIDTEGYDMVYIGHGKVSNLAAVAPHFAEYGEKIKAAIEGGQLWFVTGNARQLFGKSFTDAKGNVINGIGLFDYIGVETNKVYVCDMLARPAFDKDALAYGFANRTSYLEGENKYPLFEVIEGFGDGNAPDGKEGTLYKNFFGTWAMGPALVRSPSLMKEILKRLIGDDVNKCDFTLEQNAFDLVAAEFNKK
ncbi:MAG: hypothetical protein IJC94_07875 [Oscillospiraceae bacterium]|nr:hypothetical protein [Oscillospiraceae bacterium]